MTRRRFTDDKRGVSRMLSYMLTVGIAMVLITGLFTAGSTLVEDQHEETVRSQMTVVGERVAGSLEAADRLVRSPNETRELALTRRLPSSLAGTSYAFSINETTNTVVVRQAGGSLSVEVPFETQTHVEPTSVAGGPIRISYQRGTGLVIDNGA